MTQNTCKTCAHAIKSLNSEPCNSCVPHMSKWEAKGAAPAPVAQPAWAASVPVGVLTAAATAPVLNPASEQDRIDAQRYRWMRDDNGSHRCPIAYEPGMGPPLHGDALDAAIDADIESTGQEGGK